MHANERRAMMKIRAVMITTTAQTVLAAWHTSSTRWMDWAIPCNRHVRTNIESNNCAMIFGEISLAWLESQKSLWWPSHCMQDPRMQQSQTFLKAPVGILLMSEGGGGGGQQWRTTPSWSNGVRDNILASDPRLISTYVVLPVQKSSWNDYWKMTTRMT